MILAQKQADGSAYLINAESNALARQIDIIAQRFHGNTEQAAKFIMDYTRALNYGKIADGPNKAVYFFDQNSKFSSGVASTKVMTDMLQSSIAVK